jgi:valyl-tRNA synthetase
MSTPPTTARAAQSPSSAGGNSSPVAASGAGTGEGMPKQYRPADHEARVIARWNESGAFHADPARVLSGEREAFGIFIPPPNVTGALHLGHALNNTLQDILTRAHRMQGFETLWMPGTDHAGIATQAVVERRLRKEGKLKGPLKDAMTREQFVQQVQAWKDEYEATITGQLKAMGCSCDFARQRFTMDDQCAAAVREAFFRLFRDGLIYRGKRLVNWDPALQTAVADDECYDEEVDAAFYYLRYPLVRKQAGGDGGTGVPPVHRPEAGGACVPVTWGELVRAGYPGAGEQAADEPAWVTVATTRPETYLGDTAVALNPHDPRGAALRGLHVRLPLVGRVIPIVEDGYVVLPKAMARSEEEASDPKAEFATGFLKVTPAHDQNDNELYTRHKAAIDANSAGNGLINMMSPDGRVSDKHGWTDLGDAHIFVGKTMAEARKLVVKEFETRGLLEAARPYRQNLKFSDRSKAVIEPYLSDQWYVRVTNPRMAGWANAALVADQREHQLQHSHEVTKGLDPANAHLRFYPARYAKTFETWHNQIRDWCISRQLWWGHQIQAWHPTPGTPSARAREVGSLHPDIQCFAPALDRAIERGRAWSKTQPRIGAEGEPGKMTRLTLVVGAGADEPYSVAIRDPEGEDRELVAVLEAAGFKRDPDVLDTWFSSALWPLSTLGWPDPLNFPDTKGLLEAFNPSTVLSTAREIITLWVSRMVMFNRYFLGTGSDGTSAGPASPGPVPFHNVFIHAVVQDGDGKRMSKSAGNGVDPLDIISSHGADALRFTMCQLSTNTQDVRLPVTRDPATGRNSSPKFDLGRNFANKLWNAARFAMGMLGGTGSTGVPPVASGGTGVPPVHRPEANATSTQLSLPDRWLLSRLAGAIDEINRCLREYDFAGYAQAVYDLLWRDFCDWYLEAIKPTIASDAGGPAQRAVLRQSLDAILRLLHPVIPFVTEVIHEQLRTIPTASVPGLHVPPGQGDLLCLAPWPKADDSLRDPVAEAHFELVRGLVTAVREVRAQHDVAPKRRIRLHAPATHAPAAALIARLGPQVALVQSLAGIESIEPAPPAPGTPGVPLRFEGVELHLSNLADAVDAGAERERLTRRKADLEKSIAAMTKRLESPGYTDKAPAKLVEETRSKLAKEQHELAAVTTSLGAIGG